MAKRNLKESALKYEISINTEKVLDVLEKLNFIEHSNFFSDSNAYCWIDDKPSEADIDKVLKELGY